jgi:16S rRNA processing protein RimM
MSGRSFDDLVAIGVVVKPQGRKGEVAVEPFSDRPDRFPGLRRVFLPVPGGAARPLAVIGVWPHKGRYVVKLEGVDSITEAELLRGQELRIGEEELAPLPAGSYYHHQLRGLRVEDEDGRALGAVRAVMDTTGEAPVLEVRGERGEVLIPLAEAFVRKVDLSEGRIVVARPSDLEPAAAGTER